MPKQIDDQRIYEAVVDALLEHGYAGATTRLIAERAGVNEVTLFRKYGSKPALVGEALLAERQPLEGMAFHYSGDFIADVQPLLDLYQGTSARQAQLFMLIMAEMVRYPELRETLQVPFRTISRFGRLITRYQAEGVLRAGDPLLIAGALLGPIIINSILRAADPDLPVPALPLQVHLERFVDGYAA